MKIPAILLHCLTACAHAAYHFPRGSHEANVQEQLALLLSEDAVISFPSSPDWDGLIERASTPRVAPGFLAVVEVATEKDVQQTIKVANKLNLPFLAVTGSHGWTTALERVKYGIQINMRRLNSSTLHEDGESATVGGGIMQHEIVAALAEHGKQAGPLLGGGHSLLQAKYGFAADNILSARVVLADGAVVTASESENTDLFWALRGAGHNFGIVTSFEVKTTDVAKGGWTMVTFTFSQDRLEEFFDTWNQLEVEHEDPGMLVLNGVMARDPSVGTEHPVINLQIFHDDTPTSIDAYVAAFRELSPIAESNTTNIPYGDIYEVGGLGLSSPVCRKNENILGYPNSFLQWDGASIRRGFNIFSELTSREPFMTSAWLLESYGRAGPQSIPEGTTAVAPEERRRHLLTSPMLWWKGNSEEDAETALKAGKQIQEAIRPTHFQPHTYVNYASGGEPVKETYGHEACRMEKLTALKKKWDPSNRFGFYAPLVEIISSS
ncbi:6-hydroxy-D-nicotine oxidase [Emericellopsis cladophorae]|uniref:6-hydroxy-D-nicotine oxidase n=1 Tax=Emericellopsis cladophorae TaxID=2686198 RepID=A0A9P9Y3P8_9HYPO|nr:6-hydroxy-D-nicotine oxidase [Emericellopsis cladophorae]KAI6782598.1 6-hydroxy-D-nicotine oxidase [Emericellopsis cladophorae]